MDIDEFTEKLSKALRGANEGDNSQLLILKQMKEDPIVYSQSLLQIIEVDESLRSLALIELKNIIKSNYETFPNDFILFLSSEHIKLFTLINDPSQLRIMVPNFILFYDTLGQNWEDFPSVFVEDDKKLPFQIELLSELLLKLSKNAEFIMDNMELFLNITLSGLQQEKWDIRTNCIRITFLLSALDPEAVEPHISLIISFIQQSSELDEKNFLSLWHEFTALIEAVEIPEDQLQVVFQSAVQSLDSEHLSCDAKAQALSTLTLLPLLDGSTIMNILDHSFNLAVVKAGAGEYLDSIIDIYKKAIANSNSQTIYNFLKEKVTQSISSEASVPETFVVFLFLIKSLIEQFTTEIQNDWQFYNEIIEKVSEFKSDENTILLETSLMFISSLDSDFEVQLLQSHLFADFSVPLIANPSVEVRQDARDAVYNALDSVSVPIKGITDKIWSINSSVTTDEGEYMTILAKAIEQEGGNFESEKAIQMSEFLISCYNESNDQMLIGALSVATTLILMDESVHEILVGPTVEVIQNCLISKIPELQLNGLKRMSSLYPNFKESFSAKAIENVENLIQGKLILIIDQAAACLSVIAKELNNKSIIDAVIPVFQQWINEQDENYFGVAIASVRTLTPVLELDKIVELFEIICNVAAETKKEEIISDCFTAIGSILSKAADLPVSPKLIELTSSFVASFLEGKSAICKQIPPLDCDFKLSTINSFADLLCELLHYESESNELIFQFAQSLISSQETDYIDTSLAIIAEGIMFDAFNDPKEKSFIVSFVSSLCDSETDIKLVQSIAHALLCLIEKDIITEQVAAKVFPEIMQWWQNIYANMKEIMLPTLSNLSILIWMITLKYEKCDVQIFQQTFELFPPNDISDTTKMCNMLITIADNQQMRETFPIQIALAISRLLILPKMMIIKRNVADEIVSQLGESFGALFNSNPEAQKAVLQLIGESHISNTRLMSFVQ